MKIRNGFVSNSSSASYSIPLKILSEMQIEAIKKHSELGEMFGIPYADDRWQVIIGVDNIKLDTSMDNFDMETFLEYIGIEGSDYNYESGHWDVFPPFARGARRMSRRKIKTKDLFRHFVSKLPFHTIEEMAKKSDKVRAILADPGLKLEQNDED